MYLSIRRASQRGFADSGTHVMNRWRVNTKSTRKRTMSSIRVDAVWSLPLDRNRRELIWFSTASTRYITQLIIIIIITKWAQRNQCWGVYNISFKVINKSVMATNQQNWAMCNVTLSSAKNRSWCFIASTGIPCSTWMQNALWNYSTKLICHKYPTSNSSCSTKNCP